MLNPQQRCVAFYMSLSSGQTRHASYFMLCIVKSLEVYSFLMGLQYHGSEIQRYVDGRDEAGGTAKVALPAVKRMIDSMTKTVVFFSLHTSFMCRNGWRTMAHWPLLYKPARERFKMPEQWIHLGMVDFSPPRDGRYLHWSTSQILFPAVARVKKTRKSEMEDVDWLMRQETCAIFLALECWGVTLHRIFSAQW